MNTAGKPPIFNSPQELQESINNYFNENDGKCTICGLAYALGFASRQSIYDYEQRNDGYSYIIKRARLKIESRL